MFSGWKLNNCTNNDAETDKTITTNLENFETKSK